MELTFRLDPTLLPRLRAQTILKSCRQGAVHVSREAGTIPADDDERAPPLCRYRCGASLTTLGGAGWRAEMLVEQVRLDSGDLGYCRVVFRLLDGGSAPLTALLQALAERLPLQLAPGGRWSIARALLRDSAPPTVKSKAPSLAADASNAEALQRIAAAGLTQLLANRDCLLASGEVEAIHQMRVALRRLRSAMSLFKALLNGPLSQEIRSDLRWLQQTLGGARDGDVLLAEMVQPLEPVYRFSPGFEELVARIEAMRRRERTVLLAELASPRCGRVLLRLACWLSDAGNAHPLGGAPVRELALDTLNRRYRRVRKQMARFHSLDETGRHECRIQIKKLRYAIDFFGGIISDRRAAKYAALLARLQDSFGRLNDIATARRLLQQIALDAEGPPLAWAAGQVAGWHQACVETLLQQAWDGWHEVEKSEIFWKLDSGS